MLYEFIVKNFMTKRVHPFWASEIPKILLPRLLCGRGGGTSEVFGSGAFELNQARGRG